MVLFDPSTISIIANVVYLLSFFALFAYGQRIQFSIMQRGVRGKISKLDEMQAVAKWKLAHSLGRFHPKEAGGKVLSQSVERLVKSFVISPVSLDPRESSRKWDAYSTLPMRT
jgi:hypothetical protein